jgi:hypothetical protein
MRAYWERAIEPWGRRSGDLEADIVHRARR